LEQASRYAVLHAKKLDIGRISQQSEAGRVTINNAYVFFGIASALFAYILYTMIRARKGSRPGSRESETEL